MTPPSLLIIDDAAEIGELIALAAERRGLSCVVTAEPDTFFAALSPDISLIFLDLLMPNVDGIEVLRLLGSQMCKTPIVLMSGVGERVLATAVSLARAQGLTVAGHLRKPFRLAELEAFFELSPKLHISAPRSRDVRLEDHELTGALDRDEFVLHYQPQIEILSGKIVGVEALVRWQHPVHGLIYPDSFIARCEAFDLISQLGVLVAAHALSEIANLTAKVNGPLLLSINVSAFSLLDLSFPDTMLALAHKHNKNPEEVVLEITETGSIAQLSQTLDVLTRLRMKGFQISIDDFGTGYATMQQLCDIPATEIKIDRSFVMNMDRENDLIMVLKAIEIGHELGLRVVAEGVETAKHLDVLRANRCDIAQGFLFSKPLPMESLLAWLESYEPVAGFDTLGIPISAQLKDLQAV